MSARSTVLAHLTAGEMWLLVAAGKLDVESVQDELRRRLEMCSRPPPWANPR